jgi:pyruvate oxidase
MNEADLLLVFGASFSQHTGITPKKPIVQVDFDPMALGKFHPVTVPVLGRGGGHREAPPRGRGRGPRSRRASGPRSPSGGASGEPRRPVASGRRGAGVHAASVFAAMNRTVPEDAIVAGRRRQQHLLLRPLLRVPTAQRVLMSGYLGSIGFALPAAIGAWAATQEAGTPFEGRKVVSISGDGGLGQYLAELTTAVKYGMNITHVLLNNSELGKISKEQRAGNWDVWQTSLHNPDFSRFAENCGALGIRVTEAKGLDEAFAEAFAHPGPSLVEVLTDPLLL